MQGQKYKATITYFLKADNGVHFPKTEFVRGGRTAIFNRVNEILIEKQYDPKTDLIELSINIREDKTNG